MDQLRNQVINKEYIHTQMERERTKTISNKEPKVNVRDERSNNQDIQKRNQENYNSTETTDQYD